MALSLACEVRGLATSPGQVQELARSRGYTLQGEMFSAGDMATLAREILGQGQVLPCRRLLDTSWLLEVLAGGGLFLVPYDCAANHSPSLAGGRRAHWGLVAGLAWKGEGVGEELEGCQGWRLVQEPPETEEEEVWLVARQSKSLVLGLWSR